MVCRIAASTAGWVSNFPVSRNAARSNAVRTLISGSGGLPVRPPFLLERAMRLPQRDTRAGRQRQRDSHRRRDREPVTQDKFSRPVPPALGTRQHRLPAQVSLDVLSESIDGRVSGLRLFPDGLQNYRVQISAKSCRQSLYSEAAANARLRFVYRSLAGSRRGDAQNGRRHIAGGNAPANPVRAASRQQFVKQ